jgi:hypothetical protein
MKRLLQPPQVRHMVVLTRTGAHLWPSSEPADSAGGVNPQLAQSVAAMTVG